MEEVRVKEEPDWDFYSSNSIMPAIEAEEVEEDEGEHDVKSEVQQGEQNDTSSSWSITTDRGEFGIYQACRNDDKPSSSSSSRRKQNLSSATASNGGDTFRVSSSSSSSTISQLLEYAMMPRRLRSTTDVQEASSDELRILQQHRSYESKKITSRPVPSSSSSAASSRLLRTDNRNCFSSKSDSIPVSPTIVPQKPSSSRYSILTKTGRISITATSLLGDNDDTTRKMRVRSVAASEIPERSGKKLTTMFPCTFCPSTFEQRKLLHEHVRKCHGDEIATIGSVFKQEQQLEMSAAATTTTATMTRDETDCPPTTSRRPVRVCVKTHGLCLSMSVPVPSTFRADISLEEEEEAHEEGHDEQLKQIQKKEDENATLAPSSPPLPAVTSADDQNQNQDRPLSESSSASSSVSPFGGHHRAADNDDVEPIAQSDACHACQKHGLPDLTQHVDKTHPDWVPCLFSFCTAWFETAAARARHLLTAHTRSAVRRLPAAALSPEKIRRAEAPPAPAPASPLLPSLSPPPPPPNASNCSSSSRCRSNAAYEKKRDATARNDKLSPTWNNPKRKTPHKRYEDHDDDDDDDNNDNDYYDDDDDDSDEDWTEAKEKEKLRKRRRSSKKVAQKVVAVGQQWQRQQRPETGRSQDNDEDDGYGCYSNNSPSRSANNWNSPPTNWSSVVASTSSLIPTVVNDRLVTRLAPDARRSQFVAFSSLLLPSDHAQYGRNPCTATNTEPRSSAEQAKPKTTPKKKKPHDNDDDDDDGNDEDWSEAKKKEQFKKWCRARKTAHKKAATVKHQQQQKQPDTDASGACSSGGVPLVEFPPSPGLSTVYEDCDNDEESNKNVVVGGGDDGGSEDRWEWWWSEAVGVKTTCFMCQVTYASVAGLAAHMKRHATVRHGISRCPLCKNWYVNANNDNQVLRQHLEKKHGIITNPVFDGHWLSSHNYTTHA